MRRKLGRTQPRLGGRGAGGRDNLRAGPHAASASTPANAASAITARSNISNYSLLGDPVNLASRLESLSKIYGIDLVIGEETAARLGDPAVDRDRSRSGQGARLRPSAYIRAAPERIEEEQQLIARHSALLKAYRAAGLGRRAALPSANAGGVTRAWHSSDDLYAERIDFLPPIRRAPTGKACSWLPRNSAPGEAVCTPARPHGTIPSLPAGIARVLLLARCWRRLALASAAACPVLLPATVAAYTAAGDRIFPATILFSQAAPTDALLRDAVDLNRSSGGNATNLTVTLDKLLTERLGIGIQDGYNWIGRHNASTLVGWQNLLAYVKYEAILDPPHEFLFSVGAGARIRRHRHPPGRRPVKRRRHWCRRRFLPKDSAICRSTISARWPLQGFATYRVASAPRARITVLAGLAVEYSDPLPAIQGQSLGSAGFGAWDDADRRDAGGSADTQPRRRDNGGDSRSRDRLFREGWQFGIEARVPANRAAGTGAGVLAQFTVSLDYFFPDSIGKPLFSRR